MARSKEFLRSRDIDWAVKIGNNYIHVASAGGDLPKIVDDRLLEIWRELKETRYFDVSGEVVVNEEYIMEKFSNMRGISDDEARLSIEWYLCSFVEMARRGFYSFDRDVRTSFDDSKYRLVASPGKMRVEPEYNLPAVDIGMEPEELDGMDLVMLIDENTNERIFER